MILQIDFDKQSVVERNLGGANLSESDGLEFAGLEFAGLEFAGLEFARHSAAFEGLGGHESAFLPARLRSLSTRCG